MNFTAICTYFSAVGQLDPVPRELKVSLFDTVNNMILKEFTFS